MTTSVMLHPHVDAARRLAFIIAETERDLGLSETQLPLNDRLRAIIGEGAMRPADIRPDAYEMIYRLVQQDGADDPDLEWKVQGARDDLNLT